MSSGVEGAGTAPIKLTEPHYLVRFRAKLGDYVQLTKPRIVLLFGLTGLAAMIMQGQLLAEPMKLWMLLIGMVLTAGSANALNQYIDRDIDAVMERTRKKRPLPAGRLSPQSALFFALVIGTVATWILYHYGNALAAFFGVFTIAYYVGLYTMWLKRRTPYNIVIGGAAGATAPLIGWAAASGSISLGAWLMFLIIFMWTPPHFWALALCVKDEYAEASVPMLPVVKGEARTRLEILIYSFLLIPLTLALFFTKDCGWIYLIGAGALGYEFIRRAITVEKVKTEKSAWRLFGYSIVYLLALFSLMIVDALAAEPVPNELQNVGVEEHLGAQVDLNLTFKNEQGQVVPLRSIVDGKKPALLMLGYYGCPNLCNMFYNGATESLKKFEWTPGKEFKALSLSIDPRETPELAKDKKEAHMEAYARADGSQGWSWWVNDKTGEPDATDVNVHRLAEQVGWKYKYDKSLGQYAHSAAMVVLTPDGKISRYLYGIEFQPKDIRLALVEAGGRKIGTVMDHILLFCYNYDPKTKKYSLYATNLMRAGAGVSVFFVGGILGGFWRRSRRKDEENSLDA